MKALKMAVYRTIRWFVRLFYPKTEIIGLENLPQAPCLVIGNHAQMHGPIVGDLYFPEPRYLWCTGEMLRIKEIPAYAYQDFWSRKPKAVRWFYKLLSYIIAPFSDCVFNSAQTIPVYRDKRVVLTFRETVQRLQKGANVVIFPEHDAPYNHILCQFQDGFVRVAKTYYQQTGKALSFVPMYLAPALKQAVLGQPVVFDPEAPIKDEQQRIATALMDSITQLACSLPRHKVVPYNNLPRKAYGYNIPSEVKVHEETRC